MLFKYAQKWAARPLAPAAGAIAIAVLLSACQVRPLYSENTDSALKLASIEFSEARGRVEQEVRNRLIFLSSHGAGEPVNKADYKVDLAVTSSVTGVLLVQSSDTSSAGRATVGVTYTLRSNADGRVLKMGRRFATALIDFPAQEFAKQRSIRDAENRAARQAAEFVATDLAAALGK